MGNLVELLSADRYINYDEYKTYCEKNNMEVNEDYLNKINTKFLNRKLVEYKEYFDNMFVSVGENIFLDDEQRKIILRDEKYCLVNAGAGSGKSTTMAAKVKYLVDKLNVKPEQIIMLTFTKKSSEDLEEKVNDELELGIPVSTFHSLGMKFVRKYYPFPITVVGENEQKNIICNYIRSLFRNKKKIKEIIDLFKYYNGKYFIATGFINNYDKFDTFEEYFEDYKKRKYKLENNKSGGIHKYIQNRLNDKDILFTIKGEKVKSLGELEIANFLFKNGIDYTYEKVFDERVGEDRAYKPDFKINYQGKNIYVEYFGMSNCYNEKNELIRKEVMRYNKNRKIKEKYQEENDYDFINLDYKTPDGNYIQVLKKELERRNLEFRTVTDLEIFNRMMDNNLYSEFFKFTNLVLKLIDTFKNMLVDDEKYMFEKIENNIKKEKFKYFCYSNLHFIEANKRIKAIEILKNIYNYYQSYLYEHQMIDYSDMINLSYKHIIKDVKNEYPELDYKYIVVDEYQDITFQRFLFIKRLVEYFNAKLISVGDDWQAIYSFAGSRLELFNTFKELFQNSKDDMYLYTTYRYGQELADISSKFVLENQDQSRKRIKAIKRLAHPIVLCEYQPCKEEKKIYDLVHQLYEKNPDSRILILARTNECLNQLSKSVYFKKGLGDALICHDIPNAKVEALTMHRSKGLTADEVIVFGLRDKVFPSKGKITHWIFEYFKLDTVTEKMPFAEERRLFYVALTRTKNKVYLVIPRSSTSKSKFVNEIDKMMNSKI